MSKANSESPIEEFADFHLRHRFKILLVTMILLNVCRLATLSIIQDRLFFDFCGIVVFLAVTLALCVQKKNRVIGLILGIPAVALLSAESFAPEAMKFPLVIAARISCILFLAFVISIIILTLLNQTPTSRDSIAGAFCGYLMIGVMFAEAYCLLEVVHPNSFKTDSSATAWSDELLRNWLSLEYFSFTTLTTLGFGDVVPITPQSRFLAAWEAICGQFYLAVLVAGLVNLRASKPGSRQHQASPDADQT